MPSRDSVPDVKQLFQGFEQSVRRPLAGFVPERLKRRVQQFVDDPLDGLFHLVEFLVGKVIELGSQPTQFGLADIVPLLEYFSDCIIK